MTGIHTDPQPSNDTRPSVCVIIPTFCRPEQLSNLLDSLESSSRLPSEVIIVNNDQGSSSMEIATHSFPVSVVHAKLGLNLAGARNSGWLKSTSDLCLFIDDDNTVEPEAIKEMVEIVATDDKIGLVGPLTLMGDTSVVWCAGIRRSFWTGRTRFRFRGNTLDLGDSVWPTDEMPNCFLIPRWVLKKIAGFDEVRFPFHYDEADLGIRIREIGMSCVVAERARVHHHGLQQASSGAELLRC